MRGLLRKWPGTIHRRLSLTTNSMHREKENDTPDLEDFGLTMTFSSSAYSDAHPLSPAKGSPSRRKKLMGSLRSVGSLQSLRSPPRKERGVEHGELSVYPDVSSLVHPWPTPANTTHRALVHPYARSLRSPLTSRSPLQTNLCSAPFSGKILFLQAWSCSVRRLWLSSHRQRERAHATVLRLTTLVFLPEQFLIHLRHFKRRWRKTPNTLVSPLSQVPRDYKWMAAWSRCPLLCRERILASITTT
jgi:hypothetical protein